MYDIPSAFRNATMKEREVGYTYVLYWGEAKRPAKIKVCAMVSRER